MNKKKYYILLSFDLEEFDIPLEFNGKISNEEQITIPTNGAVDILNILDKFNIKATFYITANYALQNGDLIKNIAEKHEIASHGYNHSDFKTENLIKSKKILEKISQKSIYGFRMARMMPVNHREIINAGYKYNSSLNPTFLPGRYNNFFKPRTLYKNNELYNLPSSVTPIFRIPLFWLSFKNMPYPLYKFFAFFTLKNDGYINLYFHPWEFNHAINNPEFNIPNYIKRFSGKKMLEKLEKFIKDFIKYNEFVSTNDYLNRINEKYEKND